MLPVLEFFQSIIEDLDHALIRHFIGDVQDVESMCAPSHALDMRRRADLNSLAHACYACLSDHLPPIYQA